MIPDGISREDLVLTVSANNYFRRISTVATEFAVEVLISYFEACDAFDPLRTEG